MSEEIQHGRSAYLKKICDCNICLSANTAYKTDWARKRRVKRLNGEPIVRLLSNTNEIKTNSYTLEYLSKNGVDVYTADRYCIALGYHPAQLYGFQFYKEPENPHGYVELI